jgi:hypothetical protein
LVILDFSGRRRGAGVMSLRRAFRIAGAQTALASHWKVSDKATSQLMTEFARRWHSGEPRAKTWREAARNDVSFPQKRSGWQAHGFPPPRVEMK